MLYMFKFNGKGTRTNVGSMSLFLILLTSNMYFPTGSTGSSAIALESLPVAAFSLTVICFISVWSFL